MTAARPAVLAPHEIVFISLLVMFEAAAGGLILNRCPPPGSRPWR
jgi:hypothetical protein